MENIRNFSRETEIPQMMDILIICEKTSFRKKIIFAKISMLRHEWKLWEIKRKFEPKRNGIIHSPPPPLSCV